MEEVNFYIDDKEIQNTPIKAVPKPEQNIGIDLKDTMINNIIAEGKSSQVDIGALESFTQVSTNRNEMYALLDSMCTDSTIAAVVETYAEDATETNDNGEIVWAESEDQEILSMVQYLLNSMRVDKNIYKWTHSLCKYGDAYFKLYRRSEYEDELGVYTKGVEDEDAEFPENVVSDDFYTKKKSLNEELDNKQLNEDVKVVAYSPNDKYVHYIELVPNPAEMFELTKFGKTYAYIKAPTPASQFKTTNINNIYYRYNFKKTDVEISNATTYVHACLEDNSTRFPEQVKIFMNDSEYDQDGDGYAYTVKRGESLLYNIFKVWRELSLLENSILLNRVTKSSIVRLITVQVGDMAKEQVGTHLNHVKGLIEQKSALNTGKSIQEYTNPGPVENNVYVPVRGEQGSIAINEMGGNVDVKGLADLDYYQNKMFGSLRIPKQYFGLTDDGAGFNGGQSLTIISSRYAKMIKRIQNTMLQALTDVINLMLIDKGLSNYVNKFTLKMQAPTTQEELDRRDNLSSKVQIVSDIMGLVSDIEDVSVKLKILKSLITSVIVDSDVLSLIQDEIDKLEKAESEDTLEEPAMDMEGEDTDLGGMDDTSPDLSGGSMDMSDTTELDSTEMDSTETEVSADEDDMDLPSPQELGIDMTSTDEE